MESFSIAALLLYPLVLRRSRFSLSLNRECSPSFRFTSLPLPTSCLLVASRKPGMRQCGISPPQAAFRRAGERWSQNGFPPRSHPLSPVSHLNYRRPHPGLLALIPMPCPGEDHISSKDMTLGSVRPWLRSLRRSHGIRNRFRDWQASFDPGVDSPSLHAHHQADGPHAVALGVHGHNHVLYPFRLVGMLGFRDEMIEALSTSAGVFVAGMAVLGEPLELAEGWNRAWDTASRTGIPGVEPSPHLTTIRLSLSATILTLYQHTLGIPANVSLRSSSPGGGQAEGADVPRVTPPATALL